MFKKALSLLLSLMLIVTSLSVTVLSVSAADDGTFYVVAGESKLCGTHWSPSDESNIMTDNGDGTYTMVYKDVPVDTNYKFRIVENLADGTQNWIGPEANYSFDVATQCDVTITFDTATREATYAGDGIVESSFDLQYVTAVGAGDADLNWLHGAEWKTDDPLNRMTEVSPKVFELKLENVGEYDNHLVKFAANGKWDDEFGAVLLKVLA